MGVLKISSLELFEVLTGLFKLSGVSLLLSDLVLPSESSVFTVSDASLELSKLLLEEMPKVVLCKIWGEVSPRRPWEFFEMELLPVSGISRCFAPPPIFGGW